MSALFSVTAFCTSVVGDHLGDERPAGRVVEREHEAAGERDEVERGHRRVAHERQRGERERLEHLQGLRDDQQPALVGPVGDEAAPRAEQEHRPELAAASTPIATPLWVSWSTSRVRAIVVSQVPACEISCPVKNSRKLRLRSASEGGADALGGSSGPSRAAVTVATGG